MPTNNKTEYSESLEPKTTSKVHLGAIALISLALDYIDGSRSCRGVAELMNVMPWLVGQKLVLCSHHVPRWCVVHGSRVASRLIGLASCVGIHGGSNSNSSILALQHLMQMSLTCWVTVHCWLVDCFDCDRMK